MKTYILIPVFNSSSVTYVCLQSLEKMLNRNFSVIIGDNCSEQKDYTNLVDIINNNKWTFDIKLVRTNENIGFGGINNYMVNTISEDNSYIMLLNNDTVVYENLLDDLLYHFKNNPDCGGICPTICYYDEPDIIDYMGGVINFFKKSIFLHKNKGKKFNEIEKGIFKTDFLTGCCLLTTKKIYNEINGFDENYFLYFEDIDLSKKIQNLNKKLYVSSGTKILHRISYSTDNNSSGFALYHVTRSYYYFCLKNFNSLQKFFIFLKLIRKISGFILKIFSSRKRQNIKKYFNALFDAINIYYNKK